MTEQTGFTYWECRDCGYDAVTRNGVMQDSAPICPLCAGDNGRDVYMKGRPATAEDTGIEGPDARRAAA